MIPIDAATSTVSSMKSAQRALEVLLAITNSEHPVGLMEVAGQLKLDKSTAARMLAVLERVSFVARSTTTKKYSIGPAMIAAASTTLQRLDLRSLANKPLTELRDSSGETATLHLRLRNQRVWID